MLALSASLVGCGGGGGSIGPVKVAVPDFYVPSIVVTRQTPAKAVVANDLTITAEASDNQGAPQATLHYRRIAVPPAEAGAFTSLSPTATSGTTLTFVIPAAAVASPGVEYYLEVSDGTHIIRNPADAPATLFQELVNYLAIDDHVEVGTVRANTAVTIRARVKTDGTLQFGAAGAGANPRTGFLYWNAATAANPTAVLFVREGASDYYAGTTAALAAGTWFYRIVADVTFTDASTATRTLPADGVSFFTITADPAGKPQKPIVAVTPVKANVGSNSDPNFYVGETVNLAASISNSDATATYAYAWAKAAGTALELTRYDVSTPQLKSGVPGSFSYTVVATATYADGTVLTSDPTTVTVQIKSPILSGTQTETVKILTAVASPYRVVDDYIIPAGCTLKIEAGTTLQFAEKKGLVVLGALSANGTQATPIVFTADTALPYPGYWAGIRIGSSSAADPVSPTLPETTISFCTVQYSADGLTIHRANSPTISESLIQYNQNRGIFVQDTTLTINKCLIQENGDYGIYSRSSAPGASPLNYSTVSSNVIRKHVVAGVYCQESRIDVAKNDVAENRFGLQVVRCRTANGEINNIVANKIHDNGDGIRLEDSDIVIGGNQIYTNKDNGVIAYSTAAAVAAGAFCDLLIKGNAIHNNRDDGIHLENCFPIVTPTYPPTARQRDQINQNVVSFNGAEGIELIGSSPFIDRNIVAMNSHNGILCKEGALRPGNVRGAASPFIMNTNVILNARAGLAVEYDAVNGGVCAPFSWWSNYHGNTMTWIDLGTDPGTDLGRSIGMDFAVPFVGQVVDTNGDATVDNSDAVVVSDTRFDTGGSTYWTANYRNVAPPVTGTRFGWNLAEPPLFEKVAYEDPFSVQWTLLSNIEPQGPRFDVWGNVNFVKGPTSNLINSGEPIWTAAGGVGAPPYYTVNILGVPRYYKSFGPGTTDTAGNTNLTLAGTAWLAWPTK